MTTVRIGFAVATGAYFLVVAGAIVYSAIAHRDLFSRNHLTTRRSRLMWWLYLSLAICLFSNSLGALVPDGFPAIRWALLALGAVALAVCATMLVKLLRVASKPG